LPSYLSTYLPDFDDETLETWFGNGTPSVSTIPSMSGWDTDSKKISHFGDLYYDKRSGKVYRYGLANTFIQAIQKYRNFYPITNQDGLSDHVLNIYYKNYTPEVDNAPSELNWSTNEVNHKGDILFDRKTENVYYYK